MRYHFDHQFAHFPVIVRAQFREDVAPERVCARWCAWVRVMACECKEVLGAAEDVERRRDVQVLQDRLVVVPDDNPVFFVNAKMHF